MVLLTPPTARPPAASRRPLETAGSTHGDPVPEQVPEEPAAWTPGLPDQLAPGIRGRRYRAAGPRVAARLEPLEQHRVLRSRTTTQPEKVVKRTALTMRENRRPSDAEDGRRKNREKKCRQPVRTPGAFPSQRREHLHVARLRARSRASASATRNTHPQHASRARIQSLKLEDPTRCSSTPDLPERQTDRSHDVDHEERAELMEERGRPGQERD